MTLTLLLTLATVTFYGWWFVRRRRVEHRASWDQAVGVDAHTAEWLDSIWADTLRRIERAKPEAVICRERIVAYRVHPGPFPAPFTEGWGKVLEAGVLDPFGTIVVSARHQSDRDLWAHEMAHCITGVSDHPAWLFASVGPALAIA